jgi:oligoribonuclease NrnB/cAMP/cGMP phosphodiesterase (DHH superfamily)
VRPLVIYHAACRDGFCAAWVAWKALGKDADFHAAYYGKEPPPVAGRDVYMIDFSYPRDVLDQMAGAASSLVVLDHHKTAEEALRGAPYAQFDMERSGAGMAWDHFFPREPRPWIVDYVEDRDLWRHRLPNGPAINAYIGTLLFDFDTWDQTSKMNPIEVAQYGVPVENKTRQYVTELAKNVRRVTFEGVDVPLVNAPQVDISELLSFVAHGEAFAVGWWQRGDGLFQYSLRSREPSDVDVSQIAKRYGGGGHQRAAGFQSREMLL